MDYKRWVANNCVYEKKTSSLSDRDGIMLYENVLYPIIDKLNEGLIRSYSAKSSESYLTKLYPNIISVHNYHTGISNMVPHELGCEDLNDMSIEFAVTIIDKFDNIPDINKTVYNLCGWYPYALRIKFENETPSSSPDSVYIKYKDFVDEEKWDIGFKVCMYHFKITCIEIYYLAKCGNLGILNNNIFSRKWLYHATSIKRIRNIERNGLCPKKRNDDLFGLDCIFFSDDLNTIIPMTKGDMEEFVLLRFNGDLIKGIEAQRDKKHNNSYYTSKNINPKDIEIYTKTGWKHIEDCIGKEDNIKRIREISKEMKL